MANIIWNGVNSNSIEGLLICELPPITKPKMKTTITKINGRDGDIIEELGYESYTKSISIGLTRNYDVDEIIKYFTGSGKLVMSNEPDKEYICRIIDKIDYQKLLRFKTATIKFYTQPYKYKKDEAPTQLVISTETSLTVRNQGLEKSKPTMTIKGSGMVEISLNGYAVFTYTFPENESEVTIDSQEEEAYLEGVYKNRYMDGAFPVLNPGNNTITWTGNLTEISVQPKSRWI